MRRSMIVALALATMLAGGAAFAGEEKAAGEPAKKPVATCETMVEMYKINKAVDEIAATLLVDQATVEACLTKSGFKEPLNYNH
jgi:hypothetical protein